MKSLKLSLAVLVLLLAAPSLGFGATDMATKTKGKILLQVEDKGQAWYVLPEEKTRVYLGRPKDAFSIMQKYGLGITNTDFDIFNKSTSKASRVSGKILIKVQDSGKAYYVNPINKKLLYLGTPADAFLLMRQVGLGITNKNLDQIPALGMGTVPASDELVIDSDGDNISDDEEEILGTDPLDPDTDGDGYDDYTEIAAGFNPNGDGKLPASISQEFVNRIKSRYLASLNITDEENAKLAELLGTKNLQGTFEEFPSYSSSYGISAKEKHLADIINDYRENNGLSRLPISRKLSFTAKTHLMDLEKNQPQKEKGCDPHSWSANENWTAVCHNKKVKDSAQGILSKGRELTDYEGISVENLYTIALDYAATPERALAGWKKSYGHNIVIVNKGWAKDYEWKALGIAFYGNYVAMWVGDAEDPEVIENYSDCSIENNDYIRNECAYDNASYQFDSSFCSNSSDDAHLADCEIRTMLYECAGMSDKNLRKKCLLDSLTVDKRACNYVFSGAKYIANCYYQNDYGDTANSYNLKLLKGDNDIYFNNNIPYAVVEFAAINPNIIEISTVQNGETLTYTVNDTINDDSLKPNTLLLPYQGYRVKSKKSIKISFNKSAGSSKQDLSAILQNGLNFVGFQDNITSFKHQLSNTCANPVITSTAGHKTSKIKLGSVPQRNKAYMITCDDSETAASPVCSDSDNGLNFAVQGTTVGLNSSGAVISMVDVCANGSINSGHEVFKDYIKEYYCDGSEVATKLQLCQNGCYAGRCVEPINTTCEDSDGGLNSTKMGVVVKTRLCSFDVAFADCLRGQAREADTCNQGDINDVANGKEYVNEYYCDGSNIANKIVVCDGVCSNGSCVAKTETSPASYCTAFGTNNYKLSYVGNVFNINSENMPPEMGNSGLLFKSDSIDKIMVADLFGPNSQYGCAGKIASVWYSDYQSDNDWLSYTPNGPAFLNTLTSLDKDKGYIIKYNENCSLSYPGAAFWKSEFCTDACTDGQCTTYDGKNYDATAYGEMCNDNLVCSGAYQCKDSGRYSGDQVLNEGYKEQYCCLPTECASVIPGGPGSDDNQPHCVADGGTDQFDSPTGSYFKTCDNGVWYDMPGAEPSF